MADISTVKNENGTTGRPVAHPSRSPDGAIRHLCEALRNVAHAQIALHPMDPTASAWHALHEATELVLAVFAHEDPRA